MRKIRLLLVDDEEDFRTPIASILSGSGMEVVEAGSAQQMDTLLQAGGEAPDVVLLDINLPDESGLQVVCRLKKQHDCSVVMLSAYGEVEQRIEGLKQGADYYLSKPVDVRELQAVIHNLYQRKQSIPDSSIPCSCWALDVTKWELMTPDEELHLLSQSEFQLLSALAATPGNPVTRKKLYEALGVNEYAPNSRGLDIQVSRLRRRFTTATYTIPLKTVHSVGYAFTEPVQVR